MALKGDANFTSQPIVLAGASPVDAKMMVALKSDLTNFATWQAPSGAVGGNANLMFNYFGMLVYVGSDTAENNGLYVLQKNETDEVLTANANFANDIFRKDLANVASTYTSCWVKISQTDATIEEIREVIDTKQSESISVSGLTGATVQAVLEDISARLAGAATGGNLEALGNRVTVVEGNVSTLSAADAVFASDIATVSGAIDTVAADVAFVSGAVDSVAADVEEVSGVADANAEAIEEITTVTIPAVEAKVDTVSGKAVENAEAIEEITTVTIPAVEAKVEAVSGAVDSVAADVEAVSGVAVENAADIAEIQTALEDIYTKDETDSLITSAIADAATLEIVVWDGTIAELLQSVGETKKIYLVANSGNPNNAKDEYIYTSEGKWELIGTTATDLSNYFTKGETQSAIDTTVAGVSAGLQSGVETNAAAIKAINETTIPAVKADVEFVSSQVSSTIADVATVSGKADANASAIETFNTVTIPAIEESIDDVAGDLELVAADVEEVSGKADANAAAIETINTVTIPAVEAKVDTVSGKADANASEIAAVKATVETVSGKADANAAAIEAVVADVEYVSGQVDASVEGIEDAIEAVVTDVATVSGKADANASEIAAVKADVNAVSGSVIAFNDRVDDLEAEHDSINSSIEANAKDIEALEQADTLKANSDATNINAGLWKTALGIDTLEGSVSDNAEAIEAVATDVQTVSGAVDVNTAEIAKKAAQTDFITLSGKVDANVAAIATKASQAEFVTLSGKVDANAAAISQKAAQADLEALSTKVDTVSGKADANAAAIATLQGQVDDVYTKGEIDGLVDAVAADVQIVSAELDGVAADLDELIITVEEDYVAKTQIVTVVDALDTASDEQIPSEKAVRTAISEAVSGVKADLGSALTYKGSVADFASLPEGAAVGDTYNVEAANGNIPAGTNYAWNGTSWDALGGTVDLSAYAVKTDVAYVSGQVDVVSGIAAQNAEDIAANAEDIATVSEAVQTVAADVDTVSSDLEAVAAGTSEKIVKSGWKTKLGFIESTEVSAYQAQVDWTAEPGVTSIANKPDVETEGEFTVVAGKAITTYEATDSVTISSLPSSNYMIKTTSASGTTEYYVDFATGFYTHEDLCGKSGVSLAFAEGGSVTASGSGAFKVTVECF